MSILRPMRFQTPRSVTQTYGAPASLTIAPAAPSIPFESGAGLMHGGTRGATMAAPYMPTPAAPVTTNPNQTPFQRSVQQQIGREATSKATYASAAPLPYKPAPTPAMQPAAPASPAMQAAPGVADATQPIAPAFYGQTPAPAAPTATTPAPFTSQAPEGQQYAGAYGTGPAAEQQALAARQAYVGRQKDIAATADRGPGLGVNSYANAELQQDANERANTEAVNGTPADDYKRAQTQNLQSLADSRTQKTPVEVDKTKQQTESLATKTKNDQELQPGKVAQQGATLKKTQQTGDAAQQRALTGKLAQEDRALSEKLKTAEQKLRGENRLSESARRAIINQKITDLNRRRHIAVSAGINTADPGGLNDQINEAIKQLAPTPAPATQPAPAAGGAPATQPSAQGTLRGHDPAERTPQAIADTARIHGISEDEVLKRLGVVA